jgi:predicted lysophospholipase L1 biosynthesis ABC-type transport system permease subunit
MRRTASDYAIYFIMLMLSTGLMFAYNSIIFSDELMTLADNMRALSYSFVILSLTLVIVLAFMVNYATRFIINKRKREFGTYLLLGMERRTVARMFLVENIGIGLLSFAAGILLGMLLFQVFTAIIMHIFDQVYHIQVVFSLKTVLLTALYFILMYVLALWGGGRLIAKLNIYDLIYGSKYNEIFKYHHPMLYTVLFLFFASLCAGGIYRVITMFNSTVSASDGMLTLFACIVAVIVGVYGIYVCLASFIALLHNRMRRFRYRDTNLFLLRQIISKIQTNSRVMGVHAVVLTLSLCLLTMGLSVGQGFKVLAHSEAPFDVMVKIEDPDVLSFEDVLQFIDDRAPIKDSVAYKLYANNQAGYESAAFLKLSDYNRLRAQLGLDQKQLPENRFLIHAESRRIRESMEDKAVTSELKIQIGSTQLTSDVKLMFSEPIEQYRINAFEEFTFVVHDSLADSSLTPVRSNLIVTNYKPAPERLRDELNDYIRSDWLPNQQGLDPNMERPRIQTKSWTLSNSMVSFTTLSFGAMYISFVLFLIVATVLSMHQLTDSAEHRFRFDILRKLGVGQDGINRLTLKQLTLYFVFPIIVPILITVVLSASMNQVFYTFIPKPNIVVHNMLIALGSFLVLYMCFFLATYIGFKRNIASR